MCPNCGTDVFYRMFNFYNYYEVDGENVSTEHSRYEPMSEFRCRECEHLVEDEELLERLKEVMV